MSKKLLFAWALALLSTQQNISCKNKIKIFNNSHANQKIHFKTAWWLSLVSHESKPITIKVGDSYTFTAGTLEYIENVVWHSPKEYVFVNNQCPKAFDMYLSGSATINIDKDGKWHMGSGR